MLYHLNLMAGTLLLGWAMQLCSPIYKTEQAAPPPANDTITDEMIGQLIMMGFRGMDTASVSPAIKEQIRKGQIGSIVLFDYDVPSKSYNRNISSPEQVEALVAGMQAIAPTPLLVAIDQEGGRVQRLKATKGFPALISAQKMGQRSSTDSTTYYARQNAAMLRQLGIQVNFAPCVDVAINPDNPVIAKLERSFHASPEHVTDHARAWINAHDEAGILSVLKHFPGHGSSTSDSHVGFTDVSATWTPQELIPYQILLKEDHLLSVMTAHVFNKNIDSEYPATLSPRYITTMLRDSLGFNGIVFSDDLQMKAVNALFDTETILQKSLEAGVDILVYGNNLEYSEELAPRAIAIIRKLLDEGKISPERIRTSYNRVMRLKQRLKG